jgi:putative autoinducer-2 (AI-2) aldolase
LEIIYIISSYILSKTGGEIFMDWGMKNRLSKIIQKDGHTVMLAVDHGYFMGPTTGLENIGEMVKPLLPYADVLMSTRGGLRNYIPPEADIPICLRVSGGTSILNQTNLLHEGIAVDIEDAIRLNVAAVAFSILVGQPFERDTLLGMTEYIDEANRYGIPVLAVTAVGKGLGKDARYLSLASRMAAELGASIVKTYYCKDFEKVVDTCPVPIVIAGGKKVSEQDALQMAYDALQSGAIGVDMGRNIFQSSDPVGMIKAVNAVVHKKAKPKEAYDIFKSNKK